jgi:hypothetical protein
MGGFEAAAEGRMGAMLPEFCGLAGRAPMAFARAGDLAMIWASISASMGWVASMGASSFAGGRGTGGATLMMGS